MKGEVLTTEWMLPVNRDCMVCMVYRASPNKEDGYLPYYEQEAMITGPEKRGSSPEQLRNMMTERVAAAKERLMKLLEKEDADNVQADQS